MICNQSPFTRYDETATKHRKEKLILNQQSICLHKSKRIFIIHGDE